MTPRKKVRQWNSTLSVDPSKPGLKRGGRIKRKSVKKVKEHKDTDKLREMVRTDPITGRPRKCAICGVRPANTTHEITCGTHARSKAVYYPRIQLPACDLCNCHVLDNYKEWPIERQLAVALLLMVQEANDARGRAPTAITAEEVIAWL